MRPRALAALLTLIAVLVLGAAVVPADAAGARIRAASVEDLAGVSNERLGGFPSLRSGLRAAPRCGITRPLVRTWRLAARAFRQDWRVLAAITHIESGHGCNLGPSSAGAVGWTQFMPATWRSWGMDADGDGRARPGSSVDAVFSAARYLRASGAPYDLRRALFAYNHAEWYVNDVIALARRYR